MHISKIQWCFSLFLLFSFFAITKNYKYYLVYPHGMAKDLAFETPIGTFATIELAEEKLRNADMPLSMIKCVVM